MGLRRAKGIECHAAIEDARQHRVIIERTVKALGIENLRDEANVRHGDDIAIAEAAGDARAGHVSLQAAQRLGDPMGIPRLCRRLIRPKLHLDVFEHAHVVEGMNVAADDL